MGNDSQAQENRCSEAEVGKRQQALVLGLTCCPGALAHVSSMLSYHCYLRPHSGCTWVAGGASWGGAQQSSCTPVDFVPSTPRQPCHYATGFVSTTNTRLNPRLLSFHGRHFCWFPPFHCSLPPQAP